MGAFGMDLTPMIQAANKITTAIEHLACSLDRRNEIDSGANVCAECEEIGRLRCKQHGPANMVKIVDLSKGQ